MDKAIRFSIESQLGDQRPESGLSFTIDPATWEISSEAFQIPQPQWIIGAGEYFKANLREQIGSQQLCTLVNPATVRRNDRNIDAWTGLLQGSCLIRDRGDRGIGYFLEMELIKLQGESRSSGLLYNFEQNTTGVARAARQLRYLENQLYKTLRFAAEVCENYFLDPDFRLLAALVIQYTLTTIRLCKSKETEDIWRTITDTFDDDRRTYMFFIRSLCLIRIRNLRTSYTAQVDTVVETFREAIKRMPHGCRQGYTQTLDREMARSG